MKKNNHSLIAAILAAAFVLAGAMIYLGYQMQNSGGTMTSQADIEAGIEAYVAKQQAEAAKAQAEANKPKYYEGDYTDDDPILGDSNAPVTIVEWSDYECPFCQRFYKTTLKQIKEKYVDTGKVKFVYRDFPLAFHDPLATQEAYAANCAREQGDDDTYYAYHDLIFDTTKGNGQGLKVEQLYDMADQLKLNRAEFIECVESEKFKEEIKKDMEDGQSIGVRGTPAFLIGDLYISGAQPFEVFERAIEEALK